MNGFGWLRTDADGAREGRRGRRGAAVRAAIVAGTALIAFPAGAAAALKAPTLQSPAASVTVEGLPTFQWGAVKGAAQYEFQLAADDKFSSVLTGTGRGRGSQRTRNTAATLEKSVPDGTYFWRARAITASERAGTWSRARRIVKAWTTAPVLASPLNGSAVAWPSQPLELRWSPVPRATKYLVEVAKDPALAQSVISVANKPVETQGTVFAPQVALSPGVTYYWAVTPVDAAGQRGTRSEVSRLTSFRWDWNTTTTGRVTDLNASPEVFEPLLEWAPVPGAARYEVEINPDDDFAPGSRVCCKERVLGTSLSPLHVLPNNTYYWRVRAFDGDDNPGSWNRQGSFVKAYDDVTTTVPDVKVETLTTTDAATASPLVTWGPVAGAAEYQVQWTEQSGGVCGWSSASVPVKTSSLAWTPLSPTRNAGVPGTIGITNVMRPNGTLARWGQPFLPEKAYFSPAYIPFEDGTSYCVRVRALSDDSFRENDGATSQVVSEWTQVGGGENVAAFTYGAPAPAASDPLSAVQLGAPEYTAPAAGSTVTRTPVLRWKPVAGARRYFVLVARDPNFTNVIDAAFTAMPAYAPNLALEDEQTSYYWAVVPASKSDGSGISAGPKAFNPQGFTKRSTLPVPLGPAGGAEVATQPTFRWTPTEGAQKYRVQVSTDPQFGDLLDDVVTASTAYTSQTPYPADTALYWRVRAEQHQVLQGLSERVDLQWSAPASFRRRLPIPAPSGDNAKLGTLIPSFTWAPVEGAVSYDIHVDQADGVAKDFTVRSPAFAPTQFYGTGIFRWKVRANFATRAGTVSSAYSSPQDFTRVITPPTNTRLTRTRTRLALGWDPAISATRYRVELSYGDSFTKLLDSVTTDNTSWAPDLTSPQYAKGGTVYWRVAAVDVGRNVGAFARGRFTTPSGIAVKVTGSLRHSRTGTLTLTVTNAEGEVVPKATVRLSGAGIRPLRKASSKRGTVTVRLRPKRRGTVVITVRRRGYEDARTTVQVG